MHGSKSADSLRTWSYTFHYDFSRENYYYPLSSNLPAVSTIPGQVILKLPSTLTFDLLFQAHRSQLPYMLARLGSRYCYSPCLRSQISAQEEYYHPLEEVRNFRGSYLSKALRGNPRWTDSGLCTSPFFYQGQALNWTCTYRRAH